MRYSTTFLTALLTGGAADSIGAIEEITLYTGSPPASPESAATGTRICRLIYDSGSDVLSTPADGIVTYTGLWTGTPSETDTAGWFRAHTGGLNNEAGASTSQVRIDGTVSDTAGDIVLDNVSLTDGGEDVLVSVLTLSLLTAFAQVHAYGTGP